MCPRCREEEKREVEELCEVGRKGERMAEAKRERMAMKDYDCDDSSSL